MRPHQAASHINAAVSRAVQRGVERTGKKLVQFARAKSSGTRSTAQLRALGHPFARRHGRPRLYPGRVNIQSGEFRAGWEFAREVTPDGARGEVSNTDPKGVFLERGTIRMFARPIWDGVGDVEEMLTHEFDAALPTGVKG